MVSRQISLSAIVLSSGALLTIGHLGWTLGMVGFGYVIFGLFYGSLIVYHWLHRPQGWDALGLIVLAVFVGQLLVIDPVEPGLYGRDSYRTFSVHPEYFGGNLLETIIQYKSWPQFFTLVEIIRVTTNIKLLNLAKYIPFITGSIPVFGYLIARRLLPEVTGTPYLIGLALAGTKTVLLFETKFIDEIVAVPLFFTLVFITTVGVLQERWLGLPISAIVIVGLTIAHPVVALVGVAFTGFGLLIALYIPHRQRVAPAIRRILPSRPTVAQIPLEIFILFLIVYVYFYFILIGPYSVIVVLQAGFPDTTLAGSEIRDSILVSKSLVDYPQIVVFAALSGILLAAALSRYRFTDWEFTFSGLSAVLLTYFALSIIVGPPVGFDQSRVLIYLVVFLFIAACSVLTRAPRISVSRSRVYVSVLVAVFLISQIAAMPVHVLYSNPNETVPETDRNPSLSGQAAVEWGVTYEYPAFHSLSTLQISDSDSMLSWAVHRCNIPSVHREDMLYPVGKYLADLSLRNVVYNSGGTELATCSPN